MNNIKLVYSDLSVGAKQNFTYSLNNQWSETRGTDLQIEEPTYNHYGTLEENNWLLTSDVLILPDDLSNTYLGLWSSNLSGDDCTFDTPVELTLEASQNYSSVGFTVTFEEFFNSYPVDVNITWYRNGTQIDTKNFTCDSSQFFFSHYVENFNKVVFTFNSMNKPNKFLKVYRLDFGIIRTYTNKDLIDVNVNEEISAISNELAINTLDFKLITDDDTQLYFQYKQPVKLYINNNLEGLYYITEGTRNTINKYSVKAEDLIGALDTVYFFGGIYTNKSTEDLIDEIMTVAGCNYEIEGTIPIQTLTGYIGYCTCREALQQVLFACGMVCDTTKRENIRIFSIDNTIKGHYTESEIIQGQKTKTDKRISEVQLRRYNYKQSSESTTLYDASESGPCTNNLIVFGEPYHDLSISGGTIIESGNNYAIVTFASNSGTLTGQKYDVTDSVESIKNTNVNVNDPQNIISCDACTLISQNNSNYICQKIYDYYIEQNTITAKVVDLQQIVGDVINISNDFFNPQTGVIEKVKYNAVHNGVMEIELH